MSDPRKMSKRQEARIAKDISGAVTAASGAFWHRKGDVQNGVYKVEAKATAAKSISIKIDVWNKIRTEALLEGRIPALFLEIGGDTELVVQDKNDWLHDRRRLGELSDE